VNNPVNFIDPDGRSSSGAIDKMYEVGGNWTNVGYGWFNNRSGQYMDSEGNILEPSGVLDARSFLTGGGGAGAGSNPILNVTRTKLENGKLIPIEYGFTPSAAYLLSLISGVEYDYIYGTRLLFKDFGNGAITTGNSGSDGTITNFNVDPDKIMNFLDLMSHEVGHLTQLDEVGDNTTHLVRSGWGYVKAAISNGSTKYEDYHDKAPLEIAAERGTLNFRDFNNFVNRNYGANKLKALFENNSNTEKDRIQRINQWFKAYINEVYQKNDYRQ
ncbi:MAG: hypothetical protein K0M56_04600, partial [Kaistella sp.]|nr:hypothetical protein [Kaistella sp.]